MPTPHDEKASFTKALKEFSPWRNVKNPTYPLNRYILRRNVSGFPFAEKLSKKDGDTLREKLINVLFTTFPNGAAYKSEELKDNEMQLLYEHLFLANREPLHEEGAIFIDHTQNFIALIHLSDHLTLFYHDNDLGSQTLHDTILKNDEKMQKTLPFAFSDHFGYITAQAINLGTALSAEAIIHAPAINFLNEDVEVDDKVTIHGLASEKQVLHDLIIVTNKYCLGLSEKNIIDKVFEAGKLLCEKELAAQQKIKENKDYLNALSKDFGQALYAKSLPFHDALSLASSLDLGLSLGLIHGENKTLFFDLFFSLRRAHLTAFSSNDPESSIEEKRALHFKDSIKNLKLAI